MILARLKERIRSTLGEHPLTDQEISNVEKALGLVCTWAPFFTKFVPSSLL